MLNGLFLEAGSSHRGVYGKLRPNTDIVSLTTISTNLYDFAVTFSSTSHIRSSTNTGPIAFERTFCRNSIFSPHALL